MARGQRRTIEEKIAEKEELIAAIFEKYPPRVLEDRGEASVKKGRDAPSKRLGTPGNAHGLRSD